MVVLLSLPVTVPMVVVLLLLLLLLVVVDLLLLLLVVVALLLLLLVLVLGFAHCMVWKSHVCMADTRFTRVGEERGYGVHAK